MSWLNFNDSLNNLKGHITNFASNVLADEEGLEIKQTDFEELKKICIQQEIEINNLKTTNEQLKHIQQNGSTSNNRTQQNWSGDTNDRRNVDDVSLSDLKDQIDSLEKEKHYLMGQLEQLDLENQQNILEIVQRKEKLQNENNQLKEDYSKLKQQQDIISRREMKLKLELNELQDKYKGIQKLDDGYKEKYETLLRLVQQDKTKIEEQQKELSVLKSTNVTLQKTLEDCKGFNEEETRENMEKIRRLESENKIIYTELQKAKENIKQYDKKSSEDTETCQRLALILENYEKQVSSLKEELAAMKTEKEKNELNVPDKDILQKLTQELKEREEELNLLKKEMVESKYPNQELQVGDAKLGEDNLKKIENLQTQELVENVTKLKAKLEEVQTNQEHILLEHHDKYVKIITENIKKFQECDKPSDFQHCSYQDDPHIAEFSKQVENILKILLDFKCKCEILEKNVYDLSEEKTKILTDKNHEIEKLIQNSEILSQEVITKTQAIKDYENECNELAKNNELLINELDNYKNNSGLQTISESNEDNMVLLETQLENANKRIEDLEKIIDDFEKQQMEKSENELDNAMDQLHITESEISNKETDYHELLNSFDQLQIEFETLKFDLENTKEDLKSAKEENEDLKCHLEKVKSDYENTEYQLSEVNVNMDGMKEEIDGHKKKIDILMKENNRLQVVKEENDKINENLKSALNIVQKQLLEEENNGKEFEIQVRNLTEKLQNAKMTETSLKLQYDTVCKEAFALTEAKRNLEVTLNKTNSDLVGIQSKVVETQKQNEALVVDYVELQKVSKKQEEQLKNFEELVGDLQIKLKKYENLAVEENEELLNRLSLQDNAKIIEELQSKLAKYQNLAVDENEQLFRKLSISDNENLSRAMDVDAKETGKEYEELKQQFDAVVEEKSNLQKELNRLNQVVMQLRESLGKQASLQQQLQEITDSRNKLINIVTTKHQESVTYHNEIQRLSQYLNLETEKCKTLEMQLEQMKNLPSPNREIEEKDQELEKLRDQNTFLKDKCEVMAKNLLEEQAKVQQMIAERTNPSEKELSLQKKLDRLQAHLIELEEHYTQELLQAEQKNAELQAKVNEIEEREKSSSTMYTSVSIRANQQVESLQNQLQLVVNERDSLRKQMSDAEDLNSKQVAALANLQFVLEQFRKDKERDVHDETERIRRQINKEKQVQEDLKKEISSLTLQLEESKQGLQAASRLSDQLEYSKKLVTSLKEEVSQLQEKLTKEEEKLRNVMGQTDGKVDKSLIKNLIIGFISSNNNMNKDQMQILKIIATVLDFNQQDHDKVSLLNKPNQGSWLTSFLAPHPTNQSMSQESLSQAFIRFLENESKPRVVPSLLNASTPEPAKSSASRKSSTAQSPIVLSEIVLPTFADFAQNRNSSSILKDVLKDNS